MENASSKTVLLIDDEENICEIVQVCLEMFGNWKATTARSGEEALAALTTDQPDVIILDVMMPNMDGLTVLKQLKETPQLANIPVVLLTARADLTEPQKLLQLGVQGAIAKPFDPTKLADQISKIFNWEKVQV
jgi:CheY-like chemotaxis protein